MRQVKKQLYKPKAKGKMYSFNTYMSVIMVLLILLSGTIYSVTQVSATQGFTKHSTAWEGVNTGMPTKKGDTYPYNSNTVSITSVSLDVLYGTTRSLVQYNGEVPYDSCYKDGEAIDAFEGIYAQRGTGLHHCETSGYVYSGDYNNVSGGIHENTINFWGIAPINFDSSGTKKSNSTDITSDDGGKVTLADLENINKDSVKSLRLYALSNSGSGVAITNFFYMLFNYLAYFVIWLLSLMVSIKNIDAGFILEMLKLDKLMKTVNSVLIWDSENNHLSIFMVFAIVLFIFGIVAFVWNYVRGKEKTNSVVNILATVAMGAVVIGMCLSGSLSQLGNVCSNALTQVISAVAEEMNPDNSTVWKNQFTDSNSANANKKCQINEMALINKGYIDLQICTQFGVDNINDLKFKNLGISSYDMSDDSGVRSHLYGMSSGNTYYDLGNNLGYYFWYADSGASGNKPYMNKSYPETNTAAAEQKLNSMITLLQVAYNKDNTTQEQKDNIKNVILSFANPDGFKGILVMVLYFWIIVLLMLCTWKYAMGVLIGKLELFFGLIGFAFAGPLIITGKEKLVKTGKTILGVLLVAFIEIFAYSIMFDLILMIISSLLSTDLLKLLVVLGILLLLFMVNPHIQEKIKRAIEAVEAKACPEAAQFKGRLKQRARTASSNFQNWYDSREHQVGVDADGKAIMKSNRGNALSQLMHQADNALLQDANSHKSVFKIKAEDDTKRKEMNAGIARDKKNAALKKVAQTELKVAEETVANMEKVKAKADTYSGAKIQDGVINTEKLSADEKALYDQTMLTTAQKATLEKRGADLQAQITEAGNRLAETRTQMEAAKSAGWDTSSYEAQIQSIEAEASKLKKDMEANTQQLATATETLTQQSQKLNQTITDNAFKQAVAETGVVSAEDIASASGESYGAKVSNAIKKRAQDNHRAELQADLQNAVQAQMEDSNTAIKSGGKIGGKNAVDRKKVEETAILMQKLADVNNDRLMSTDEEAKAKTAEYVDKAVEFGESARIHNVTAVTSGNRSTTNIDNAKQRLETAKNMKAHTAEQKQAKREAVYEAKQQLAQAKADHKQDVRDGKADRKEAYAEYGGKGVTHSEAKETERMMSQLASNIMGNSYTDARMQREADKMDISTAGFRASRGQSGYDADEWESSARDQDRRGGLE